MKFQSLKTRARAWHTHHHQDREYPVERARENNKERKFVRERKRETGKEKKREERMAGQVVTGGPLATGGP